MGSADFAAQLMKSMNGGGARMRQSNYRDAAKKTGNFSAKGKSGDGKNSLGQKKNEPDTIKLEARGQKFLEEVVALLRYSSEK